jgi:hypothetical protein
LSKRLFPHDDVVAIKYFTAHVRDITGESGTPGRQRLYLRALDTIPICQLYYGKSLTTTVRMANVNPPPQICRGTKNRGEGRRRKHRNATPRGRLRRQIRFSRGRIQRFGPLPSNRIGDPSPRQTRRRDQSPSSPPKQGSQAPRNVLSDPPAGAAAVIPVS